MKRTTVRILLAACCAVALVLMAGTPVTAQYRPLNTSSGQQASPVKGEKYHIEISGNLWDPAPDFTFSSEGLGIIGTVIDLDADLALEKKQMWEARLVLRPGKKHKLRAHYLPMQYTGDTILKKDIVFNGIKYPLAVAVKTDFKWTAWRFTYEYDIFYRPRGYVGILLESKYADTSLSLENPISNEFVTAKAPIPAGGLVARVYPLSFLSITGEVTYFKLPEKAVKDAQFDSLDYDIYGTVNVGNNFGVQAGYRSIDMAFSLDQDSGSVKLKGMYFGGVLRF
jgi:hypothetical protein